MFYWLEMTNRCGFENGVIKMSLKGGMFFLAGKKGEYWVCLKQMNHRAVSN